MEIRSGEMLKPTRGGSMFKPWRPFGKALGTHPGLNVRVEDRSVTIVWEEWRNGQCIFKMQVAFDQCLASLMLWDESPIDFPPGKLPENAFDSSDAEPCSAWVERSSEIREQYGEYGQMLYKRIDRYHFIGQSTVVLLDIADAEPTVTIELDTGASV